MFTGIVQDIGTIVVCEKYNQSMKLGIETKLDPIHLQLGASVSCNGCCLTVVAFKDQTFFVDIGPESLQKTYFSHLKCGDKLNLEPALRVGDAIGGHQVTGHVDGLFDILSFEKTNNDFWKLSLKIPKEFSKYIIPKGSVSLMGISLTIAHFCSLPNDCTRVEFMIIPHTYHNTILHLISAEKRPVELEFDQAAKTIASLFEGMIFNYSQMTK